MIEGPEAFERFREAAKKLVSTPKDANADPFGKRRKKKKPAPRASLSSRASGVSVPSQFGYVSGS